MSSRLWTREEYGRMIDAGILNEDDHVELLAGEIIATAPRQPGEATAIGLGHEALRSSVGEGFLVRVQLPLALGEDSEPEPALAVVRGRWNDFGQDHPREAALVVEVQNATIAYDRTVRAAVYARAGISEYWIVNLGARLLEVYRDPAPDHAAPLGFAYRQRLNLKPREQVTLVAIAGATIAVRELLP